eukprot:scaffold675957_cov59-Prasinocladus_malaysianus.AAC.1
MSTPEDLEQEGREAEEEEARGLADADALCAQVGSGRSDATFESSDASSHEVVALSARDISIHQ